MTTVLVTRPAQQAENLCRMFEQNAIHAVRFPLLAIKPIVWNEEQFKIFEDNRTIDWLIFISSNAVQHALTGLNNKLLNFCKSAKIVAIGKATAKALQEQGLIVDVVPEQGFTSEALLAMQEFQNIVDQQFVCVRGQGGREVLADTLRLRGARVDYLEVYQRVLAYPDPKILSALLETGVLDVITLHNGESLTVLLDIVETDKLRDLLTAVPLIVISERLRLQAQAIGFMRVEVSENPSDDAIYKKVISLVSGEYSG